MERSPKVDEEEPMSTQQIKSTMDQLAAAWKTNDGAAVAAFFTDDGSLINPFGERAEGRAAVSAMYTEYFAGMLRGTSTVIKVTNVRPVGADHAFVDADQAIHAPDGKVLLAVHLSGLFRRDGERWRFVDGRPYAFSSRA
jgi:uncharacterized protein (TIGR02246 family)